MRSAGSNTKDIARADHVQPSVCSSVIRYHLLNNLLDFYEIIL